MNNKQILDNAPEGATHVSDNGVYYFMNYPVAMNYWTRGQEWVESGGIHHLCRSLSEISEIESLRLETERLRMFAMDVQCLVISPNVRQNASQLLTLKKHADDVLNDPYAFDKALVDLREKNLLIKSLRRTVEARNEMVAEMSHLVSNAQNEAKSLRKQLKTAKLDVIDSVNDLYGIMSSTMKPMSMSECLDQIEQELKEQGE